MTRWFKYLGFCFAFVATFSAFGGNGAERLTLDSCEIPLQACSEEAREYVSQTLDLMVDCMDPGFRSMLERQGMIVPTVHWILSLSQPCVTNSEDLLSRAAHPNQYSPKDFNRAKLTNVASRVRLMPTAVKLDLAFDDQGFVRPIPGVDYPGVSYEDAGSSAMNLRMMLRAPKRMRRFRVRVTPLPATVRNVEYKSIVYDGSATLCWATGNEKGGSRFLDVHVDYNSQRKDVDTVVAIFARFGNNPWGPPSFIRIRRDCYGVAEFDSKNRIVAIDYGSFKDYYSLDDRDRIVGFTRQRSDDLTRSDFSNQGRCIVERHVNDSPKDTRGVKYHESEAGLSYELLDDVEHHKSSVMTFRPTNW